MAKKKNTLGKLLAFTTAAAAIGGTCYIFRDKIKSSSLYQKTADKLSNLKDNISDKFCEDDDFFFDDDDFEEEEEDIFADTEHGREYTSITINAKEQTENDTSADDTEASDIPASDSSTDTSESLNEPSAIEEMKEISEHVDDAEKTDEAQTGTESLEPAFEETIPTISFGTSFDSAKVMTEKASTEDAAAAEITGYENEGLSDVSEDPDALEEQDKLDF